MSDLTSPLKTPEGKAWTVVVWVLHVLGFGLLSLIFAYALRPGFRGTIWHGHMTYFIRTVWMTLLWLVVGWALCIFLVGFLVLGALALWTLIRVIFALVKAISGEPIANPKTWLF